jgi:hypothetical protein
MSFVVAPLIISVDRNFFVALREPAIVGGARVCTSFVIQQMFSFAFNPLTNDVGIRYFS